MGRGKVYMFSMWLVLLFLFPFGVDKVDHSQYNPNVESVDNVSQVSNIKEENTNRVEDTGDTSPEREVRLKQIANINSYQDTKFLAYIISVEKKVGLQPCELLALISRESHFNNVIVRDAVDGKTNYGPAQIRPAVANCAREYAVSRGGNIDRITDRSLRNRENSVTVAGYYLRYLHDKYRDCGEVWTSYNRGEGGMGKYRRINGNAWSSYAVDVNNKMKKYRGIMGEYY